MIRTKWASVAAMAFVAVGAAMALGNAVAPAVVEAQAQAGTATITNDSAEAMASLGAYWTPARMAAAIPMDMANPGSPNASAGPAPLAAGPASIAGGGAPGGGPISPHQSFAKAAAAAGAPVPADGAYPGPHATYYYGPKYTTYPISTAGKLFFNIGSATYVCSADVTSGTAANQSVIWTAGHCISNGAGTFYTNWIFCPSYNAGGINPTRGCWRWTSAGTRTEWHNSGSFRRDYAYITLENCVAGVAYCLVNGQVGSHTGSLGFAWNWARDQHWHHYGYPSSTPWNGVQIVATTTEHRYDDDPDGCGGCGPLTNSWGSGQTPGSSGSPLILQFSYGGGYINSNVSYYYTSPNQYGIQMQGPYIDTVACSLWKGATGWPGTC